MTCSKVPKELFFDLLEVCLKTQKQITFTAKGRPESFKATLESVDRDQSVAKLKFFLPSEAPSTLIKEALFTFQKENLFYFFSAEFEKNTISKLSNFSKKDLRSTFRLHSCQEYPISITFGEKTYSVFDISIGGLSLVGESNSIPQVLLNSVIEIFNKKIIIQKMEIVHQRKINKNETKIGFRFVDNPREIEIEIFRALNDIIFAKNGKLETDD